MGNVTVSLGTVATIVDDVEDRRLTKQALTPTGDPWLLTPGPLTTSPEVKRAALHDYGSRDQHFIDRAARLDTKRFVEAIT